MKEKSNKKRKWRFCIGFCAVVLLVLLCAGWLFIDRHIRTQIQAQLSELNLGTVDIGWVSISGSGISANQVKIYQSDSKHSAWVVVDKLTIEHPIGELIGGADHFSRVIIDGVQINVDAEAFFSGDPKQFDQPIDLSQLQLPAEVVQVSNTQIVLRQMGREDLTARGIAATLTNGPSLTIDAIVSEFVDTQWSVEGSVTPQTHGVNVSVVSDRVTLDDQSWKRWPGVPSWLGELIDVTGSVSPNVQVMTDRQQKLGINGSLKFEGVDLDVSDFDLPLAINSAVLNFDSDSIEFLDVGLETSLGGKVDVGGSVEVDSGALAFEFSGEADELPVTALGKFIPVIPDIVEARGSGPFFGNVVVDQQQRTTVNLTAQIQSPAVRYGDIVGDSTQTVVEIKDLVVDQAAKVESISGFVGINSEFKDARLSDVFKTFGLTALEQQLRLSGVGDGKFSLTLPLSTAEQIETWQSTIEAHCSDAIIGGERVSNVDVKGALDNGNFVLKPVLASTQTLDVPDTDGNGALQPPLPAPNRQDLQVEVRWPLTESATNHETGELTITTTGAPLPWVYRVCETLTQKMRGDASALISNLGQRVQGAVTGTAQISISAHDPEHFDLWQGTINLWDTIAKIDDQQLDGIASKLILNRSVLKLESLTANQQSLRTLSGQGYLNLNEIDDYQFALNASSLSMNWLASIYQQYAGSGDDERLIAAEALQRLKGSISFQATASGLPRNEYATPRQGNGKPSKRKHGFAFRFPQIELSLRSDNFSIGNSNSSRLNFDVQTDGDTLAVKQLRWAIGQSAFVNALGDWNIGQNTATWDVTWKSIAWNEILEVARSLKLEIPDTVADSVSGSTSGMISLERVSLGQGSAVPKLAGAVSFADVSAGGIKMKPFSFKVSSDEQHVILNDLTTNGRQAVDATAKIAIAAPHGFEIAGVVKHLELTRLFQAKSILDTVDNQATEITGFGDGRFVFDGTLKPLDWRTEGRLKITSPTIDLDSLDDVLLQWSHRTGDADNSKVELQAFGGTVRMVEFSAQKQLARVAFDSVDATQCSAMFDLPAEVSGTIGGMAVVKDWNTAAVGQLELNALSIKVGPKEFNEVKGQVNYHDQKFNYQLSASLLSGKLSLQGETPVQWSQVGSTDFPVDLTLTNATLGEFYGTSNFFQSLRTLTGGLSATAKFNFRFGKTPTGTGRVTVTEAKWNRQLLTREASLQFTIDRDQVSFDDVVMDLNRGQVIGKFSVPLNDVNQGQFQIQARHLDLRRVSNVFGYRELELTGFLNARLEGRVGNKLKGRGYLEFDQARLHGVTGTSAKLPIEFEYVPLQQRGKIEVRRSRFRLFGGVVTGKASTKFGSRFDIDADLKFTNVDSEDLVASIADVKGIDQGRISGRLKVSGHDVRSGRDFDGSFTGTLDRASAFQLPVLEQVGRLFSTGNLGNQEFETDEIRLSMSRGRINVSQLNFQNALSKIAIDGAVFIDGRLNLNVAARVERLNQPTLIDEFLGSPLARFTGSPTALLARVVDFLSNRVTFLHVSGNLRRPQVRVDSKRQLREELVRYFLRDSNVLDRFDDNP